MIPYASIAEHIALKHNIVQGQSIEAWNPMPKDRSNCIDEIIANSLGNDHAIDHSAAMRPKQRQTDSYQTDSTERSAFGTDDNCNAENGNVVAMQPKAHPIQSYNHQMYPPEFRRFEGAEVYSDGNNNLTTMSQRPRQNCNYQMDPMEFNRFENDDVCNDFSNLSVTTPKKRTNAPRRSRAKEVFVAKKRSAAQQVNQKSFGQRDASAHRRNASTGGRRNSVPSVFEIFSMDQRSRSESRAAYVESLRGESADEQSNQIPAALQAYRQKVYRNAAPKQTDPGVCIRCEVCTNLVPKENYDKHMDKKHRNSAEVFEEEMEFCKFCENRMPKRAINGHMKRAHANRGNNVNHKVSCTLCSAVMHIDYLQVHFLRKHPTQTNGSIGIIWPQFNDEQVNSWIDDTRAFAKDGVLYIEQ